LGIGVVIYLLIFLDPIVIGLSHITKVVVLGIAEPIIIDMVSKKII